MLKRPITYTDFNDETHTETFYFNISKPEVIEMEVEHEGGFTRMMQNIIEAEDTKRIIEEFKKLILMSYGQRSEDGKRFIKNDTIREEFSQHAAYNALFYELGTDDVKAAEFLIGILPQDMIEEVGMTDPAKVAEVAKNLASSRKIEETKGPDGLPE